MRRFRKLVLGGLIVSTGIPVAGCDVGSEFFLAKRSSALSASHGSTAAAGAGRAHAAGYLAPGFLEILDFGFFGLERFRSGTATPTGPGTARIDDKTVTGEGDLQLFERQVALVSRNRASIAALRRLNVSRPRFAARFDGTTNSNTGQGTMRGIAVARFPSRAAGIACISFQANFTDNGARGTGTFRTIGGTRGAARVRARGSFTETVRQQGPGVSSDTDVGTVRATVGRPRRLTGACRALVGLL